MTRDRIVRLVHISELPRWLADGWTAADGPAHPVQRAYGTIYVWRWA